jgi:V/A-type H+-transporting ATPase subunit A
VDTFASIRKQYLMMKTILSFGKREAEAIKTGAQASQIANFLVKSKIAKMKWTPEDQFEAFVQDIDGSLDQEFGALAREIRA